MRSTRRNGTRKKKPGLDRQLIAYSVIAGAAMATTQAVESTECARGEVYGTICYTDIPDRVIIDELSFTVDFDDDGSTPEFQGLFWTSYSEPSSPPYLWSSFWPREGGDGDAGIGAIIGFSSSLRGPHEQVPAALVVNDPAGEPGFSSTAVNVLAGLENHIGKTRDYYFGVKFELDGATTHWGWIRFSTTSFRVMVLHDFAYEMTPDTPIKAGVLFSDSFESGDTSQWSIAIE